MLTRFDESYHWRETVEGAQACSEGQRVVTTVASRWLQNLSSPKFSVNVFPSIYQFNTLSGIKALWPKKVFKKKKNVTFFLNLTF